MGVPGKSLGDGRAEHGALGTRCGGRENADAVSPARTAAGHPGGSNTAIFEILHRIQGGIAIACSYHHTDSLLGHVIPFNLDVGNTATAVSVGGAILPVNNA